MPAPVSMTEYPAVHHAASSPPSSSSSSASSSASSRPPPLQHAPPPPPPPPPPSARAISAAFASATRRGGDPTPSARSSSISTSALRALVVGATLRQYRRWRSKRRGRYGLGTWPRYLVPCSECQLECGATDARAGEEEKGGARTSMEDDWELKLAGEAEVEQNQSSVNRVFVRRSSCRHNSRQKKLAPTQSTSEHSRVDQPSPGTEVELRGTREGRILFLGEVRGGFASEIESGLQGDDGRGGQCKVADLVDPSCHRLIVCAFDVVWKHPDARKHSP
eukprot:1778020-Rhodomonas_salina.1